MLTEGDGHVDKSFLTKVTHVRKESGPRSGRTQSKESIRRRGGA